MHPKNLHQDEYDFSALIAAHPKLKQYVHFNKFENQTINFADPDAVLHLNKAILHKDYKINYWDFPEHHLCPPIPGRADYILHLADFLQDRKVDMKQIKGLDIGVGANSIYPLLATRIFKWKMVGADINEDAVKSAEEIVVKNQMEDVIQIRKQRDHAHIFKNIIEEGETFSFTMCNPPFYSSEEEAHKNNVQKRKGLEISETPTRNFRGLSNELWCNGGESLFIKRMIKESILFRKQVIWFSSLVSKKENLPKIYKQLNKIGAKHYTVEMEQGNKKSRFVTWSFV